MQHVFNMANNFCIERATPDHSPVLLEMIKELAAFEKLLDSVTATAATLRETLAQDLIEAYFCYQDGILAGYAIIYYSFSSFEGRKGLYLEDIYIRPAFRGKGLGKAMLAFLAKRAVETGCPRFEWTCLDWNISAQEFYQSLGATAKREWIIFRTEGAALGKMGNAVAE